MANQIETLNGIAVTSIEAVNGLADAAIEKINGLEFTGVTDAHTLIATATASASATLSFTSGIDSTYDAYEFRFDNMHPATDQVNFSFQVNAAGASGFNETITSTAFQAYHAEDNSGAALVYRADDDQAQGTAYQNILSRLVGNAADEPVSGILTLYAPSSTTYVKHFTAVGNGAYFENYSLSLHTAGYINTTSAIDEISFKMSSGNIDAGEIKMYGIAKA